MPKFLAVDAVPIPNGTVLRLRGSLTYDQRLATVREVCSQIKTAGLKRIIVDLRAVPSIDSSGLSALLKIRQTFQETKVVLLSPSDRVRTTLEMMRVSSLFEIVTDESDLPADAERSVPPLEPDST